jgi:exosortase
MDSNSANFKPLKFVQYYYFIGTLCLIFLLDFKDFNTIFTHSFSDGGYISKDTGIWAIALFLFFRSLDPGVITSKNTSIFDVLFLFVIICCLFFLKTDHSVFIPVILLGSIWFYSARPSILPTLAITCFYLLLSLPFPFYSLITPYLQSMAISVLEGLISLFNIPVLVQENFIAIPKGQFVIEEGCSGLKFLSVNLVLLFLYILLSKFNFRQIFFAFITTISISFLMNWVRIFIIVIVAHNWGFEVPYLVKDHGNFGWVVYTGFLVPMFYFYLQIDKMFKDPYDFIARGKKIIIKIPSILMLFPIFIYSIV